LFPLQTFSRLSQFSCDSQFQTLFFSLSTTKPISHKLHSYSFKDYKHKQHNVPQHTRQEHKTQMPGKSYQKQMISREYQDHLKRMNNVKSIIQTTKLGSTEFKFENKKKQIDRLRQSQMIEIENHFLLERLAIAMSHKTIDNELYRGGGGGGRGSASGGGGGRSGGGSGSGSGGGRTGIGIKSLIQTHRKLELQRITQENQRLLKRIQETEPCYNHLTWEMEAKKREGYLRNMSEFHHDTHHLTPSLPSVLPGGGGGVGEKSSQRERGLFSRGGGERAGGEGGRSMSRNRSATTRRVGGGGGGESGSGEREERLRPLSAPRGRTTSSREGGGGY
jgi:hypothetical protein